MASVTAELRGHLARDIEEKLAQFGVRHKRKDFLVWPVNEQFSGAVMHLWSLHPGDALVSLAPRIAVIAQPVEQIVRELGAKGWFREPGVTQEVGIWELMPRAA